MIAWCGQALRTLVAFERAVHGIVDHALIAAYFVYYLVGKFLGIRIDAGVPVTIGGARFILRPDRADHVPVHEICLRRTYAPDPSWMPGPGDVVVDLGANTGVFTVLAALAVGPTGRVISVEPHAPNVAAARRNLAANSLRTGVELVQAAVWSSEGIGKLVRDTDSESEWRLEPASDGTVVMTTVDALVGGTAGRVSLLKCDIEGGEVEAFLGASRTLARTDRVVVECHSRRLRLEVERLLDASGFVEAYDRPLDDEVAVVGFCRAAAAAGSG